MSSFDPSSIKPDAAPDFKDASGCAKWLQSLPLINVGPSHVRLLAQLDELNAYGIAPAERLKILELLREPVSFVQKEHSKKFSSRPAPLAKPEREILERVYALWDALSYGYQHCLKAFAGGSSATNAALVGERVLWCIGQRMLASYQAYQDVGEREWKLLHSVYAFVEERGVAGGEVAHPTHKGRQTTCTETYAQVLLARALDAQGLDRAHPPRRRRGRRSARRRSLKCRRCLAPHAGRRHDPRSRHPRAREQRAQARRPAAQRREPCGARSG